MNRHQNLVFLVGVLAVGCSPDEGDSGGNTASTTGGGAEGSTGSTSASSASSSSGGETSAGSTGSGDSGSSGETAADPDACDAFAEAYEACYGEPYDLPALEECKATLEAYADVGPDCLAAQEALWGCLSGLDCKTLMNLGPGFGPCTDAFDEVDPACQ